MKLPLLGTLLALAAGAALAAPATNLVLRSYDFPLAPAKAASAKSGGEEFITLSAGAALRANLERVGDRDDKETQKQLEKLGIAFPSGAWVRHLPSLRRIFVLNTPENHEILRLVLDTVRPAQVAFDYAWIDFPLADIEAAARAAPAIVLDDAQVLALWRAGKGRLMNSGRLVTRSGVNAQNQCVTEVIYPTDFDETSHAKTGTNVVSEEKRILVPGSFETRQVGFIFNVTPTVDADGEVIDVTFVPEHTELTGWDTSFSPEPGPKIAQPSFHTQQVTASMVMKNGHTTAFGGWASADGARLAYLVLRATVVDAESVPFRRWEAIERAMAETP